MTPRQQWTNTCDKAVIVGLLCCAGSWCVIESLDNVFTLLNCCQMCLCWVSGWQGVTESHRECHFNSGNYLDKNYNLEMLNFSFCSEEKLCEDKLWRSYILLKMNVIKLSLHQIGLWVTGARTFWRLWWIHFQKEIYLNAHFISAEQWSQARIKLILRDSLATLI